MEASTIFTQLSLVLLIIVAVSVIMRFLRQPLIMGYIITGVLVGPSFLHIIQNQSAFDSFSTIGIALLLFIIGLGLNAGVIQSLGKVSFITSMSILPFLGGAVFGASLLLGYSLATAAVLAVGLFFSSTIIVMKALSDKKETTRLFGQITLGVLLIEDLLATIAVVVIAMLSNPNSFSLVDFVFIGLKAVGLGVGLYVVSNYVLPHVVKHFARSQELLFLFSVAWGFTIASLFEQAGFSHEVGALFAGVSLAGLPYASEMASKLKPLRDFFIVIFFVTLGESFTLQSITNNLLPAHVLAAVIIIGKPLLTMMSLMLQGYTKLTSFKTAVHLSQISEFSIIFVTIAASKGLIPADIVSLVTLIAFITIGVSAYLMKHANGLYRFLEPVLRLMERNDVKDKGTRRITYNAVLVGYHKGGYEYVKAFRELKERYLVIDYDPAVIDTLEDEGIRHAYGDATDEEFLDEFNVCKAKLVVSTMTDYATNISLLRYIRSSSSSSSFICHAGGLDEAERLYEHGATYVTLPHYIGSERVSAFIKRYGYDQDHLENYRQKYVKNLGRQAVKQ